MENMKNKLQLIFGDWSLGVKGENFHYIFSYKTGGLESFYARGKEWLYRTPMPVFWRALTDNDRGCHFHETSGIWMSASRPISKRERMRSSSVAISFGGRSEVTTICLLS